jgi:hypothetical protein
MIGHPEMRSPAPALQSGTGRAEGNRNETLFTIASAETEADMAALYLARRYRIALPLARTIAALASLGRAFA